MPPNKAAAFSSYRPAVAKETPLIDRVREMSLLKEAADKAITDNGGLVFLYGEAGIGKTRLTRELRGYARSRGMQILYGRCPVLFRMNGVPPYSPWRDIIRSYLQICTPEQLQRAVGFYPGEIYKIAPEIEQKLITFAESPPLSPELERDRLLEVVSQFFTNISKTTPLIIVLDDLQRIDQASLSLLHYIARGIYQENILLVGAYRDTEIEEEHPLLPVLTELNRARLLQSAQLRRLSSSEVAEMVKRILDQDDVPSEFCQLVYEKTGGNPFFVEEVVSSLNEEGIIRWEDGKCVIGEVSEIKFPETVKDVLKARLGRLDEECRKVLTMASFIGNDFTFEALRKVTGIGEKRLLEMVERILKTGLIKCRVRFGEDLCSFADALIRDVLYEEVNPLRRKILHDAVAHALEKVYASRIEDHFGELATHFLEGGDKDNALSYFLKAGDKAAKVYANDEAASHFLSALRLMEQDAGKIEEKACVLEKLGDVKGLVGHRDALKYWNEALQLREQRNEKEKAARLHRKMANLLYLKLADVEKAKEHQSKALRLLEPMPESVELVNLRADMARMYWRAGERLTKALPIAEQALPVAERLCAYEALANLYHILGLIQSWNINLEKGVEYLEKALKIALDNNNFELAATIYTNLGHSVDPADRTMKGLEYIEKGYELAKKVSSINAQALAADHLARRYVNTGNINMSLPLSEESIVLARKSGDLDSLCLSLIDASRAYSRLGEWEKCEQYAREALDLSHKAHFHVPVFRAYLRMGSFLFDKGEFAEAKVFFEKGYEICQKTDARYYQHFALDQLALTSIELGELDKAECLIERMQQLTEQITFDYALAFDNRTRAALLRAQKKWNEAIELFETSLRMHDALDAKHWRVFEYAHLLCEYARVYMERNMEGDKERALNLLNQAMEIFQRANAKKKIEKTKAKITYLQMGRMVTLEPPSPMATGCAVLDRLLGGGVPLYFAAALTSPSCDERDTIVKGFLETGAKKGETTFYLTINPRLAGFLPQDFESNFMLFVCNPQAETIIKGAPSVYTLKGVESLTNINIALTQAIRKLEPSPTKHRRICIDLVSDVLLQHHAVQARKWLAELLTYLRSNEFTTLTVLDPQMHPTEDLRAILSLFECEISIREAETDKGETRFLRIRRMSGQKYLKDEVPLTEE